MPSKPARLLLAIEGRPENLALLGAAVRALCTELTRSKDQASDAERRVVEAARTLLAGAPGALLEVELLPAGGDVAFEVRGGASRLRLTV